jgi:transcriptional regulator with XRE-family HTH domain
MFFIVISPSLPQYQVAFSKAGARMPKTSNKSATKIDKLIGEKIREERLKKGLSQEALAAKLGITFQQVQKYEKGTNRVGSGRLYEIAELLGAPVASFFEAEIKSKTARKSSPFDLLADETSLRMVQEFSKIGDVKLRRAVLGLVERMVEKEKG